jgi:hypothetical protein
MGVFALILLPFNLLSVFTGFTFTDVEDFMPLLTLIIGLSGVALIRLSSQNETSQNKASPPLIALLIMLSLWPILPQLGLFFLAREFQSVYGSWPQVFVDTPWTLSGEPQKVSPQYSALFRLVNYLEAFSGAWMVIFLALFLVVMPRLSSNQRRLCLSLMFVALLLVVADPGHLYAWWMD